MDIYLTPPKEEDWRFWSASISGQLISLVDYQKQGGKRTDFLRGGRGRFYFRKKDTSAVEELVSRTKGILGKYQHVVNGDYMSHLAISFFYEAKQRIPKLSIEEFLKDIKEENIKIYYGLPFEAVYGLENIATYLLPIKFGRFEMGRAVLNEISELFPEEKEVNSSLCVALSAPQITARTLPLKKYSLSQETFAYYAEVLRVAETKIIEEFRISQAISCAILDVAMITESVLHNEKLHRFACFSEGEKLSARTIDTPTSGLPDTTKFAEISEIFNDLNLNAYPLNDCDEITPIDPMIRTFLSLIYRGFTLAKQEHISEAYLLYVMALDLLLGGKSDNNSNVQKRCAVIFMYDAESALSYEENKNKIRHLYNKRSRYVHEGKKVTASELQDSKLVCNAVTKILFSLRAQLLRLKTAETSEKSIEKWHKNLDLVSAIHEADAIPNASQLELAHISTSQKESV